VPGGRDIVVIGASAGGIHAIEVVLAGLPKDFPGSVFIVLHLAQWYSSFDSFFSPQAHPNFLIKTFGRSSRLPVRPASDGDPIVRGEVYVGVPNSHLVVERGTIRLQNSPRNPATGRAWIGAPEAAPGCTRRCGTAL
jgi:two-component system chemotaxis response regulator CheB